MLTSRSVTGAETVPSVRLSPKATNRVFATRGVGGGAAGPAGGSGFVVGGVGGWGCGCGCGVGVGWLGLLEQPATPVRVSTIRQAAAARMDLTFYGLGRATGSGSLRNREKVHHRV